ncbi:VOC family protein [Chloroflexota bacterium]
MKVDKIDHIHVYVKDLDQAILRFSDILGVEFTDIFSDADWGIRSAYASLGIDVVQPTSNESGVAKTIEHKGEGLAGISFRVSNIEDSIAELQSKGLRLMDVVQVGGLKEALFHPRDFFGVFIELCEYPGDDIHKASMVS